MTAPLPPLPRVSIRMHVPQDDRAPWPVIEDDPLGSLVRLEDAQKAIKLAVREALELAAQKYAGQRLVDGNRVSEELSAMIEEYKND